MLEELEPLAALDVLDTLAADADRKATVAELPQELREKLGSAAAMHSPASKVGTQQLVTFHTVEPCESYAMPFQCNEKPPDINKASFNSGTYSDA